VKLNIEHRTSNIVKRWLLIAAASCCFWQILFAQRADSVGFEIVAHRLRMEIVPPNNFISCVDTLQIHRLKKNVEQITLDFFSGFHIEKFFVDGDEAKFKQNNSGITFDDIPSDTAFDVVIEYSGELRFRSDFTKITEERAVLRTEEVFPSGPQRLRFVRMELHVPSDWTTIACGKLVQHDTTGRNSIFVWESKEVLTTLGWICAGKYTIDSMEDLFIDSLKIPLAGYFFPEDTLQAESILSVASQALRFYSKHFTPYRFPKLSIVEVDDWVGGRNVLAVASPSFVMVKRTAFTTKDDFNKANAILPHEIAHQWWPLTVFINQEDAALLSEGMCEYSSVMFTQAQGTMTARDSLGHHPLLRSLLLRVQKGNDLPLQQKADLRSVPTQYLKSSYVHHMLRQVLGDSVFQKLYAEYAATYNRSLATQRDFQQIAERLSGKNLDWFFDQWVKGKGVPRMKLYNVKSVKQGGRWNVRGRVRIVGYDKYTTFADVGVETAAGMTKTRLWLGADSLGMYRNDVPFEIMVNQQPLRAVLDPNGDVLKMQKLPARLSDLRNPSDGVMIVGTKGGTDYLLKLARSDSVEMDKAGWSITIKFDSAITLQDLQQEKVLLYGKASENSVVAEYEKKFPYGFRNDSLVVGKEVLFDSTLTLIQAIESPFITNGLLCWIAPSSETSQPKLLPYDASWVLLRDDDEVSSGTWEVRDEDLVVEIK
jgi:hypothetical protein